MSRGWFTQNTAAFYSQLLHSLPVTSGSRDFCQATKDASSAVKPVWTFMRFICLGFGGWFVLGFCLFCLLGFLGGGGVVWWSDFPSFKRNKCKKKKQTPNQTPKHSVLRLYRRAIIKKWHTSIFLWNHNPLFFCVSYDNLNLPQCVVLFPEDLSVQYIEWSCSGNESGLCSDCLKGPIFAEVGKGCQN